MQTLSINFLSLYYHYAHGIIITLFDPFFKGTSEINLHLHNIYLYTISPLSGVNLIFIPIGIIVDLTRNSLLNNYSHLSVHSWYDEDNNIFYL